MQNAKSGNASCDSFSVVNGMRVKIKCASGGSELNERLKLSKQFKYSKFKGLFFDIFQKLRHN